MNNNIYFEPSGRLGNALFRYFSIIILLKHNPTLKYSGLNKQRIPVKIIGDILYKKLIKGNTLIIPNNNYSLNGFFQLQEITYYAEEIKQFLKDNTNDIIYNYPYEEYKIDNIVNNSAAGLKQYDIVIHIRLEDFVNNREFIPYTFLIKLLNNITKDFFVNEKTSIVVNKPTSAFEHTYIDNIKLWFDKYNIPINIESNDIITDFHIMKNAKKIICSNSTISWCAALLSDNIEICYMPDYKIRDDRTHQTFKYPIKNTILYDIY